MYYIIINQRPDRDIYTIRTISKAFKYDYNSQFYDYEIMRTFSIYLPIGFPSAFSSGVKRFPSRRAKFPFGGIKLNVGRGASCFFI